MTRDPSSLKRKEKLEHIGILFINMHHLLNEYRPHQARDLLRQMLAYQVRIANEFCLAPGCLKLVSLHHLSHHAIRRKIEYYSRLV